MGGSGTQTAGLAFGGQASPGVFAGTEKYDGSAWSNAPNMATARTELAGGGTQVLALGFGGSTGSLSNATEEFTEAVTTRTMDVS